MTGTSRRVRALLCWVLATAGGLTLVASWALSSPPGASPDEPAHIYYAWGVATGQVLPGQERLSRGDDGATKVDVTVPPALIQMEQVNCYAFDVTATPTCGVAEPLPEVVDPNGDVHRLTYMTRYPPVYYGLVGAVLRAGTQLDVAGPDLLVLARVASGALSLAVLATACVVLGRRFGGASTVVVMAVAAMPAAWSHFAAVNPNGFEVASAILLAACVAAVRSDAREGRSVRAATQIALLLAVVALAWARPLSLVWAGLLLLLLLLPVRARSEPGPRPRVSGLSWTTVVAAAVAVLGAAVWMLWSTRTRSIEAGGAESWTRIPTGERVLLILNRFFDMVRDGVSLLGWGDTLLPLSTFLPWLCVGTAVLAALASGSVYRGTRPLHALAVALGAVVAVGVHSYVSAFGWQGRYVLPVLASCVVLLAPSLQGRALAPGRRLRLVVVLVSVSGLLMVVSVLWNLGRYAYGYRAFYRRFAQMPLPDGPATWEPLTGVGSVVLAAAVGTVLLVAGALMAVGGRPGDGLRGPTEPAAVAGDASGAPEAPAEPVAREAADGPAAGAGTPAVADPGAVRASGIPASRPAATPPGSAVR